MFFCMKMQAQEFYTENGIASYYGADFHGKRTAYGERYNMKEFTAAHNELPYNTLVEVTCLQNNKSTIVRINDKGPRSRKRAIDLSRAAAEKIGLLSFGLTHVSIKIISSLDTFFIKNGTDTLKVEKSPKCHTIYKYKIGRTYDITGNKVKPSGYGIQVASSRSPENTSRLLDSLQSLGFNEVFTEVTSRNKRIQYLVVIGAYAKKVQAVRRRDELKVRGIDCIIKDYLKK